MKMYYEKTREEINKIVCFRNQLHVFDAHFHDTLEIFVILKGEYAITLNGQTHRLTSGSVCVFDSFDIHSYDKRLNESIDDAVILIPTKYLSEFKGAKQKIQNPIIYDKQLCQQLLNICDVYLVSDANDKIKASAAGLILSLIADKLVFYEKEKKNDDIPLNKILNYIYENFKEDISLSAMSKALGFTEEHISRVFNKSIRMSLPVYINNLRIQEVNRLKTKYPDKKMSEIIYLAGFNSLATYYRAKNR